MMQKHLLTSWNLSVISEHDNWNKFCLSNFLNTKDLISAKLLSTSTVTSAWSAELMATVSVAMSMKYSPECSVVYTAVTMKEKNMDLGSGLILVMQ